MPEQLSGLPKYLGVAMYTRIPWGGRVCSVWIHRLARLAQPYGFRISERSRLKQFTGDD